MSADDIAKVPSPGQHLDRVASILSGLDDGELHPAVAAIALEDAIQAIEIGMRLGLNLTQIRQGISSMTLCFETREGAGEFASAEAEARCQHSGVKLDPYSGA